MKIERCEHADERWVMVEAVAECYHVEVEVLRFACQRGLLLHTESRGGVLAISVRELSRIAVIVRLHVHQGVPLESVELFLE